MGRVVTEAIFENPNDLFMVEQGIRKAEEVRNLRVPDALGDTGATYIGMPKALIERLGYTKPAILKSIRTAASGIADQPLFGPVRLTIQGRIFHGDIMQVADHCPVLIGQLPLEGLDLIVDPKRQRLIGNPEHGGVNTAEAYGQA